MTKDKLERTDIIRIKRTGTIAVIAEVAHPNLSNRNRGWGDTYALNFRHKSKQKYAWYERDELEYIGSVKDLIARGSK
jgi:hypothetical protein